MSEAWDSIPPQEQPADGDSVRLRSVIERLPVGIAVIDTHGKILMSNPAFQDYVPSSIPSRDPDNSWRWRCWLPDGSLLPPTEWPGARALRGEPTVPGIEFLYSTPDGREIWTRVSGVPLYGDDGAIIGAVTMALNVDAEKHALEALRRSEDRQVFLLDLADTLRPLSDPAEVQGEVCRLLGAHLNVSRVVYADIEGDEAVILKGYADGVPPMPSRFRYTALGASLVDSYHQGETVTVRDTQTDPRFTDDERAALAAFQIAAFAGVMLHKEGRWIAAFGVHAATPRSWSTDDLELIREVGERVWAAVERAKAETALRLSQERFQTMADGIPHMIWVHDAQGRIRFINRAYSEFFGVTLDHVQTGGWTPLVHPDDRSDYAAAFAESLREQKPFHAVARVRRGDGEWRWVESFGEPRFSLEGKFEGIAGSSPDITERKLTDEALQRERSLLASITRSTDVMLVYLDREFNFVWVNESYARSCRMRVEDMLGKNHFALFPHEENETIFRRVRDTGKAVFFKDKPFVFPNQPERGITYWDWSLMPVTGNSGQTEALVFSLRETTRYRQIEIALQQSEERFRIALQNSPITVATLDRDLRYTWVHNTRHGFSPETVVGRRPDEILPREHVSHLMAVLERVLKTGQAERQEITGRTGDTVWEYDATVEPRKDEAGELTGLTLVLIDTTERRRIERQVEWLSRFPKENPHPVMRASVTGELLYANRSSQPLLDHWRVKVGDRLPRRWQEIAEEVIRSQQHLAEDVECSGRIYSLAVTWVSGASYVNLYGRDVTDRTMAQRELAERGRALEAANAELANFGSYLAHDLRAPLRAISGFAEILSEDYAAELGENGKDLANRIAGAARRANDIIDALKRLVQLGTSDYYPEEIDLGKLAAEIFPTIKEREAGRECRLTIGEGLVARADRRMMTIALTNLFDNAVKYSSKKPVSEVEFGRTQHNGHAVFYVRDNGIGFDTAYIDQLFEPFQRLHRQDDYPGTGLGLPIVRRVIGRHGGQIWADSDGNGSTFYFTL